MFLLILGHLPAGLQRELGPAHGLGPATASCTKLQPSSTKAEGNAVTLEVHPTPMHLHCQCRRLYTVDFHVLCRLQCVFKTVLAPSRRTRPPSGHKSKAELRLQLQVGTYSCSPFATNLLQLKDIACDIECFTCCMQAKPVTGHTVRQHGGL